MQDIIYDVLLESYKNTNNPDKNTIFSGDIQTYSEAIDDLEDYNRLFRQDESDATNHAFDWLSSLPPHRRQALYDLYSIVKHYISGKVDETINRQHERVSGDRVSDIVTNLTLMWPQSYEVVNSNRFRPQKYDEELYPVIAFGEDAESQIIKDDSSGGLSKQLQELKRLTELLNVRYDIDPIVKQVLGLQTATINSMAKKLNLETE